MNADLKRWKSMCKGRWGAWEAVLLADDAASAVDRRSYLGLLARILLQLSKAADA
jgi:hypothetical protein